MIARHFWNIFSLCLTSYKDKKYFNIYCLFAHFWQSNCYTSEEWWYDDTPSTEEQLEADRGTFILKRFGGFCYWRSFLLVSLGFVGFLCFFFFIICLFVSLPMGIVLVISFQVWKWKRKLLLVFFFSRFKVSPKEITAQKQSSLFALLCLIDLESDLTVSSEEMWIQVWNALCWFLYIIYCEW